MFLDDAVHYKRLFGILASQLIADRDADWRQLSIGDGVIETYEDMYYDTLLMLYTTYANIKEEN